MKEFTDKVDANWDDVQRRFSEDGRIRSSHSQVPGQDGKFGFGGSCFPKDIESHDKFFKGDWGLYKRFKRSLADKFDKSEKRLGIL